MRAKRIVNRVRNAGKLLKEGKIQGGEIRVRKHSNGGGVDDHLHVLVLLIKIVVKNGDTVVYSKKKMKLAPGEMESITLKPEQFENASQLSFELEV